MKSPVSIFLLDTLRSLGRDCSGVSKIESSLIIALVTIVVISGANDFGALLYSVFNDTAKAIQQSAKGQSAKSCGPGNGNGNCGNRGNGGGNSGGSGPGTGNGGRGTGNRGAED